MVSETLLDILACPVCKSRVELLGGEAALVCGTCGLKFPVRDGIPVLLADEAKAMARPDACKDAL